MHGFIKSMEVDNMQCSDIQNNLTAYLHGELSKNEIKAMHKHLSECDECLNDEIELMKAQRILNNSRFEILPDNFDVELNTKLQKIDMVSKIVEKNSFRRIIFAIAATFIITIGLQFFAENYFVSQSKIEYFEDYSITQSVFKANQSKDRDRNSLKKRILKQYGKRQIQKAGF